MTGKPRKSPPKPDQDELMKKLWAYVASRAGSLSDLDSEVPDDLQSEITDLFDQLKFEIPAMIVTGRELAEIKEALGDNALDSECRTLRDAVKKATTANTDPHAKFAYHEAEAIRHAEVMKTIKP